MDGNANQNELETFDFDVFLSHSSKDKPTVRALAERLKAAGLKVWFDEWALQLGDPIFAKVQQGLERSRILLLFMSRNCFGSDWATLEHQTILFRDPLNRDRRFIPLRLDDGDIPDVLGQFKYLDWRTPTEVAYQTLVDACRPAAPAAESLVAAAKPTTSGGKRKQPARLQPSAVLEPRWVLRGHEGRVRVVAVMPDGRCAVSGSTDTTVRVWDLDSGACAAVLEGHKGAVWGVAISADGRRAVSGSWDKTVRVWNLDSGACAAALEGHGEHVNCVAVTADGRRAVSGSWDKTVRVWDLDSGACAAALEGHKDGVMGVAVTSDGRRAVSGSIDRTVRVWDLDSGACAAVLEGHKGEVWGVAISADGRRAVSGSIDRTVRVWDLESGACAAVLEGHAGRVLSVAVASDGCCAASGGGDRAVRVWDLESGACAAVLEGHAGRVLSVAVTSDGCRALSADDSRTVRVWDLAGLPAQATKPSDQTIYTNAKVLLTGDSGTGKTGLAQRLALRKFEASYSTDGVWATQLKILERGPIPEGVEREIWLWDFAGQADYRLIHQLFMDGTDLALLVFDPQKDNPFEGLAQWDHDLTRAAGGRQFLKRLVAGRCDRGGLRVSQGQIEEFQKRHGYLGYHATSALTGDGCADLHQTIVASIPWDRLPKTSSPTIFKRIKANTVQRRMTIASRNSFWG